MSVQIKICGITSEADGRAALDAGADFIGFIFYEKSPRYIEPDTAAQIISALGAEDKAVGVFVNASANEVTAIAETCSLAVTQLHGDEDSSLFSDRVRPVWRAVKLTESRWTPEPDSWSADRYLVDASVPDEYGGTGVTADWTAAKELADSCPVMLAGGLNPENILQAIRAVCPLGVDVSSGVEASPGIKDHARIREFITNARSA